MRFNRYSLLSLLSKLLRFDMPLYNTLYVRSLLADAALENLVGDVLEFDETWTALRNGALEVELSTTRAK